KCGPDAASARNPDSRFDFSVLHFIKTLRLDAPGSIFPRTGSDRTDHQVPMSVQKYILPAILIILELIVPAIGSKIEGPFGRIGAGTVGTIELVGPHLGPLVLHQKSRDTEDDDRQSFHHTKPCDSGPKAWNI